MKIKVFYKDFPTSGSVVLHRLIIDRAQLGLMRCRLYCSLKFIYPKHKKEAFVKQIPNFFPSDVSVWSGILTAISVDNIGNILHLVPLVRHLQAQDTQNLDVQEVYESICQWIVTTGTEMQQACIGAKLTKYFTHVPFQCKKPLVLLSWLNNDQPLLLPQVLSCARAHLSTSAFVDFLTLVLDEESFGVSLSKAQHEIIFIELLSFAIANKDQLEKTEVDGLVRAAQQLQSADVKRLVQVFE